MPVLFNNCLALLNRIATPKKQQVFCELIFQKKKDFWHHSKTFERTTLWNMWQNFVIAENLVIFFTYFTLMLEIDCNEALIAI